MTAGTNNRVIVDVHSVAEFGASGTFEAFPAKSLHPSPEHRKQWSRFVHAVVFDKQPRSIDFAK